MRVSFGSTYAIKYDYIKNNKYPKGDDRRYKCQYDRVDNFINEFDKRYKGKDEVSSFNPEKKIYFLNIKKRKDKILEALAKAFGIGAEKVSRREMKGSQIVSVGCGEGNKGELKTINSMIIDYNIRINNL